MRNGGIRRSIIKLGYHSRPDFIIIGAQKAGTTYLFNLLSKHPQLIPSFRKEIHHFDDEESYQKGILDYWCQFPLPHRVWNKRLFESTPAYLFYSNVPGRIKKWLPEIQMIVILRDPIERIFSAWNMFHNTIKDEHLRHLHDYRSFDEAIEQELTMERKSENYHNYLKRGVYHEQLERYFRLFNRDQILILENSEVRYDLGRSLGRISNFLDINNFVTKKELKVNQNSGLYTDKISEKMKSILVDYYEPHNKKLFELIGRSFEWGN